VTGPLANPVDAAARASLPALQRRAFICVGNGDDERVAAPVEIGARLGVRDGERSTFSTSFATARFENARIVRASGHAAPADEVGDEARLPRARVHPPRLRAHGLLLLFHDSH